MAATKGNLWHRTVDLYVDGFRNMTVGRKVWALLIVKLIIFFAVIKLLFFPNILAENYDSDDARADAVRQALIDPLPNQTPINQPPINQSTNNQQ